MSTIPLTFKDNQVDRTVVGGVNINDAARVDAGVILLNARGCHFVPKIYDSLIKAGFQSIISIEPSRENYNIESFAQRFPCVKFMVPKENATTGALINMAVSEISTSYFLVLRDNLNINERILLPNLFSNLTERGIYCIIPRLLTKSDEQVPIWTKPEAHGGHFTIVKSTKVQNEAPTLMARDFIALYNRKDFIELGGFDYTIENEYYQSADLALRSWLWGLESRLSTSFFINYEGSPAVEDTTRDFSYLRFYLKNITPTYRTDHAHIPFSDFFPFFTRSSCGIVQAARLFFAAKEWVAKNKYRFKTDLQNLIENWGDR